MTDPTIVIDYEAGNLKSVENALRYLGAPYRLTREPDDVRHARSVIFPGVGEARASMDVLNRTGMGQALKEYAASGNKMLGICIGCQVVFDYSEERDTPCLGIVPGVVRRFAPAPGLKVPHMGWNAVRFLRPHPVFEGIPQETRFYFVHSYYPVPTDAALIAAEADYGAPFATCIARDNLVTFQCHVEKSGHFGLKLLSNFLAWDGRLSPRKAGAGAVRA
ncbi:MAG TPA: imidazole glycerol phosphate synthase subunit HisH [Spirochaetia bacterium]|nr:imidazole glycerol phosphate synthase subunit HisH [Spirochaetia bacterium]